MTKHTKKTRLSKDAPIAIIGCGIAGLSAAISLTLAGYSNVSIFERDVCPGSRREGFGLTLTYNPKGPLEYLGILEQVAQEDCPSRSHYIFAPNGKVLGYYGNFFRKGRRGFGQRGNMRCPRRRLQEIMTNRLQELLLSMIVEQRSSCSSCIHWGYTLSKIEVPTASDDKNYVQLQFTKTAVVTTTDTDEVHVDPVIISKEFELVIAADGVRSSIVESLAPQCQPRPLNVMIILGITDNFQHPLLTERGFYVIDGHHRLFTMPYQGDTYTATRRIMWQLSYRSEDDDGLSENEYRDPAFLRDFVIQKCSQWMKPVLSMVQATPIDTIWGTLLMDRSPKSLQEAFRFHSRIVCIGDALHAMSPFKGQGANNALLDGPLIVEWLQRASLDAAVRGIWREAVQRTNKVVQASREAAVFWHSSKCIPSPGSFDEDSSCHFSGVQQGSVDRLLRILADRNVAAELSADLDASIKLVIEELGIGELEDSEDASFDEDVYSDIINFSAMGATSELRKLSLKYPAAIGLARNANGRSALHVAAANGHHSTCRWLLTEISVDPKAGDFDGRVPADDAQNLDTISLLKQGRLDRGVYRKGAS